MCGRFARFTPQHLYASLFGARDMGNISPRYNIAPTQAVLVARNSDWGGNRERNALDRRLSRPCESRGDRTPPACCAPPGSVPEKMSATL